MENSLFVEAVAVLLELSLDDEVALVFGVVEDAFSLSRISDDDSVSEADSVVEYRLELALLHCLCGGNVRSI